jgi:spore germination cell wall hydrolase CwlJ-like protein
MSDKEWNYLVRATIAEASPKHSREQGYIMAVILNRTRKNYLGDSDVVDVLKAPLQFQAVTGSRKSPGPSKNFTRKYSKDELESIVKAATKVLPNADRSFLNFTAYNPKAYDNKKGLEFRQAMIDAGAVRIGGTVFGTV